MCSALPKDVNKCFRTVVKVIYVGPLDEGGKKSSEKI